MFRGTHDPNRAEIRVLEKHEERVKKQGIFLVQLILKCHHRKISSHLVLKYEHFPSNFSQIHFSPDKTNI